MAKQQTVLEVFIASPGDVFPERKAIEQVVSDFNISLANTFKVRLELIGWETHVYPSVGQDAQDVINRQILDEFDIFIGIMWGRFGTETGRAGSGTEEEFQRAYSRLSQNENIQIMFYFKNTGIPPSNLDVVQITKVKNFQSKIGDEYGAYYNQFESTEDFKEKVRSHLNRVVSDWTKNGEIFDSKPKLNIETEQEDLVFNPLANFLGLENSVQEDGLIDLTEKGADAIERVNDVVMEITNATLLLSNQFKSHTKKLEAIVDVNSFKEKKKIVNYTAKDIEDYVELLVKNIPIYHKEQGTFIDSFRKIVVLSDASNEFDRKSAEGLVNSLVSYCASIESALVSLVEFQSSIKELPRASTAFNSARRKAVAVMEDLQELFRSSLNQLHETENLLADFLD